MVNTAEGDRSTAVGTFRNGAGRARRALVASDPGLLRFRLAATATLSVLLALGVLAGIAALTGRSVLTMALGVVLALIAAMAVNDPKPAGRALTTVLLPLPATASATVAALLAENRVVADVAFVGILAAATYARRWAPRGMALGFAAFIAYFVTLVLRIQPDQLALVALSAVVGAGVSLLVRHVLLPPRPERELRRLLRALRARASAVVDATRQAVLQSPDVRVRNRLHQRLSRLNDTALMVQDRLEADDAVTPWPGVDGRELALRVFDAELAIEQLGLAGRALPDRERPATGLLAELDDLRAAHRAVRAFGLLRPGAPAGAAAVRDTLSDPAAEDPAADAEPDEPQDRAPRTGPFARQALQVSLAAGGAIVLGTMISPTRWYWAVIAAFVVFIGATTRGEILTRGWARTLGTLAGVPAGVLLAALVGDHELIAAVLIVVCVFAAFYLVAISTALLMFWITSMLALLYGLLGMFTPGLLVVRLVETALGAALGIVAAYIVLPTSTRETVTANTRDYLAALADLVEDAVGALAGTAGGDNLVAKARDLDDCFRTLGTSALPLTDGMAGLGGRAGSRRRLRILRAVKHYARGLARHCAESAASPAPVASRWSERESAAVTEAGSVLRGNLDALRALLDGQQPAPLRSAAATLPVLVPDPAPDRAADTIAEHLAGAVHFLSRLDRAILVLGADLGAELAEQASA